MCYFPELACSWFLHTWMHPSTITIFGGIKEVAERVPFTSTPGRTFSTPLVFHQFCNLGVSVWSRGVMDEKPPLPSTY